MCACVCSHARVSWHTRRGQKIPLKVSLPTMWFLDSEATSTFNPLSHTSLSPHP